MEIHRQIFALSIDKILQMDLVTKFNTMEYYIRFNNQAHGKFYKLKVFSKSETYQQMYSTR